jgi:hypothetical protein
LRVAYDECCRGEPIHSADSLSGLGRRNAAKEELRKTRERDNDEKHAEVIR